MTARSLLLDQAFEWHAFAWGLGLLPLLAAALVSWFVVGEPGRVRRAMLCSGPALLVLSTAALLPRLVQLIHPDVGWGPQRWLLAPLMVLDPDTLGGLRDLLDLNGTPALHPYDTAVIVHLGATALAGVVWAGTAVVHAFWPPRRSAPLPLATWFSILLGGVALLLPLLLQRGLPLPAEVPALEWVALAPAFALLLAARVQGAWTPRDEGRSVGNTVPVRATAPDVLSAWKRAGVLSADAEPVADLPDVDLPTQPALKPTEAASLAWAAAGVDGPAPGALGDLLEPDGIATWLVGDLPPHTENALVTAFLAARLGTGGDRALVVVDDPTAAAERLAQALDRVHTWDPGHLAVGAPALREALARHRLPVATFVTPADLASHVVPLAGRDGRTWAASLTWLVVARPDMGGPRAVSHTAFTFRRWQLATADLTLPSVLVTAPDTPAVLAFLEGLLPGRPVRRCPLRPRLPGRVQAWPARVDGATAGAPWTVRAAEAAIALGVDVHLADPGDRLDRLAHQDPHLHVDRRVNPDGTASVAELDGADLAAAWRAAWHVLHDPDVPIHHALWHVHPSPLAHFLTARGRLRALHDRRELPVPRPVVGTANRFLRLAHLRAALEDGHADERALRKAFGDDVVDFVLRDAERTGTWVARIEDGQLVRAPVLRGPPGVDAPEPGDEALTSHHVEVIDGRTGEVLTRVDSLLAATRYHPKRVFGLGSRRYRVPLHALDAKRGRVLVEAADPRDAPTLPLLRFALEARRTVVERVSRRQGGIEVTTLTVDAVITEEVYGAWVPGQDQRETFEPVRARYDSEVRLILPERAEPGPGLGHLAGLVRALLPAHLRLDADDFEVIAVGRGLRPGLGAGIAVIDRHVGGLGIARTLDDGTVIEVLRWARAVLYACSCEQGCVDCTPESVLRARPDKQAVLRMLPVE